MQGLGLHESDIVEKFIRSGGKGGQNLNKVATCVYLKHLPTGIEIKMQKERSQALNRYLARRLLADRVENEKLGRQSRERMRIERIRRQKRRRSRRSKEKMLRNKKIKSEKKSLRRTVGSFDS